MPVRVSLLPVLLLLCRSFPCPAQQVGPWAHSHNDYEQPKPFHHAFGRGFRSIEADVWLIDGRLLVAHDRVDARTERSLAALYLDPLASLLDRKGRWKKGPKGRRLQLLIDFKSESAATLGALQQLLLQYPRLIIGPALTFAVSGNRPPVESYGDWSYFIRFDGRPGTAYDSTSLERVALISDTWANYIDRNTLRFDTLKAVRAVEAAHNLGKPFRFWACPDNETGWQLAARIGTDFLNTDRIDALADFLEGYSSLENKKQSQDRLSTIPGSRVTAASSR